MRQSLWHCVEQELNDSFRSFSVKIGRYECIQFRSRLESHVCWITGIGSRCSSRWSDSYSMRTVYHTWERMPNSFALKSINRLMCEWSDGIYQTNKDIVFKDRSRPRWKYHTHNFLNFNSTLELIPVSWWSSHTLTLLFTLLSFVNSQLFWYVYNYVVFRSVSPTLDTLTIVFVFDSC